jgi:hypothetical protein
VPLRGVVVVGAGLVVVCAAAGAGAAGGAGVVAFGVVVCDGELPSGSWYWLSPALPPASAAAGKSSARQVAATAARWRRCIRHSYHARVVIQRIVLVCVSAAAIVVLGVWLHSTQLAAEGAAFKPSPSKPATPAQTRTALSRLERARKHNPDTTPDVDEGIILSFLGRNAEATRILSRVVHDEPRNARAWGQLSLATRQSDPARSAAAAARVRQLVPPLGG